MGWLKRIARREDNDWEWAYPATSSVIVIPEVPERFSEPISVPSRSVPGQAFVVNLRRLTCTCPNFRSVRQHYQARDIRRICPHLYHVMLEHKLTDRLDSLHLMIIEHGRRWRSLARVEDRAGVEIIFGYNRDMTLIGVFAIIGENDIFAEYDPQSRRWINSPPPDAIEPIHDAIKQIFRAEPQ